MEVVKRDYQCEQQLDPKRVGDCRDFEVVSDELLQLREQLDLHEAVGASFAALRLDHLLVLLHDQLVLQVGS